MAKKTNPNADVEALRRKLKNMPRPEAIALADRAGIPHSTFEKFRNGFVSTMAAESYLALQKALATERVPAKHQGT